MGERPAGLPVVGACGDGLREDPGTGLGDVVEVGVDPLVLVYGCVPEGVQHIPQLHRVVLDGLWWWL